MKPNAVTCLLLIACVLNLLFGCSHRKAVPLPELHALWCLLVTQAECKQLLPVPSDS